MSETTRDIVFEKQKREKKLAIEIAEELLRGFSLDDSEFRMLRYVRYGSQISSGIYVVRVSIFNSKHLKNRAEIIHRGSRGDYKEGVERLGHKRVYTLLFVKK